MKIIKQGEVPWWVGVKVECPSCKLVAEFEPGDEGAGWIYPLGDEVRVYCPNCGQAHTKKRVAVDA